jgi:hypothetical protein
MTAGIVLPQRQPTTEPADPRMNGAPAGFPFNAAASRPAAPRRMA